MAWPVSGCDRGQKSGRVPEQGRQPTASPDLTADALLDLLRTHRLLAIIRSDDLAGTVAAAHTLVTAGVRVLEISLTGRDALSAIARVAAELGSQAAIGAGTVLTEQDAVHAGDAGAQFAVTPAAGPGTVAARRIRLPVVPGVLTPTEVAAAVADGAAAVKLFPASLGGPEYLTALRAPFPDIPFVPVGGIGPDEALQYLRRGAVAVGIGSPLVQDAASGGDLRELARRARTLLDRVADARP